VPRVQIPLVKGFATVVLAKGQLIESSRDFDATRPCRGVDALE
jgi:hypothetical protein